MVHWRRNWQSTPVFLLQEPHEQMKIQKDMTPEGEPPPPPPDAQYASGVEWRVITNSSRKNEAAGPKQK